MIHTHTHTHLLTRHTQQQDYICVRVSFSLFLKLSVSLTLCELPMKRYMKFRRNQWTWTRSLDRSLASRLLSFAMCISHNRLVTPKTNPYIYLLSII